MITAFLVGSLASVSAIAFVECVAWMNNLLLISPRSRVQFESTPYVVTISTIFVPALGGLIVGLLLTKLSQTKRPHGPPDVINAAQFSTSLPDARSGALSTITAAISLGCGASVGQYGPMVYLGAMFGNLVRRFELQVPNLSVIALACGVAAAISTAFNAPIAGLVFAHEVVLRHYSTQAFAPTTVASATGYVMANVVFDRPALFLVDFEGVQHGYEFLLFAVLGLCAAGVAIGFMHLLLRVSKYAASTGIPAILRPATAGLMLGVLALWLPDILGIGKEVLRFATIEGAFGANELVLLIIAKLLITAICIGFGFSGGVFSPSLLIGILLGALFWTIVSSTGYIQTSGIQVYAISGMMALASPVIGAPLTCILIVFELTRNYDITIAAMVAVVFSNLVGHRLFGRSLFDRQLADRGVDLSQGRDRAHAATIPVQRFSTPADVVVSLDDDPRNVRKQLTAANAQIACVVDHAGRFIGFVFASDLDTNLTLPDVLDTCDVELDRNTSLTEAMEIAKNNSDRAFPLIDNHSGRIVATITPAVITSAYLDVCSTLRKEENAAL